MSKYLMELEFSFRTMVEVEEDNENRAILMAIEKVDDDPKGYLGFLNFEDVIGITKLEL